MTVWKFPFEVSDHFSIEMPYGAQLLHVAVQHGNPCIWALVDPGAPKVKRDFRLMGTGHDDSQPLPRRAFEHVGSFFLLGGDLVFHLFDLGCP